MTTYTQVSNLDEGDALLENMDNYVLFVEITDGDESKVRSHYPPQTKESVMQEIKAEPEHYFEVIVAGGDKPTEDFFKSQSPSAVKQSYWGDVKFVFGEE